MIIGNRIKVVNVKHERCNEYIGREWGGYSRSILANAYKIGQNGDREEVIRKYKRWLWWAYNNDVQVQAKINNLARDVINGRIVVLGCWCKPSACHGDVVMDLVEYVVNSIT